VVEKPDEKTEEEALGAFENFPEIG